MTTGAVLEILEPTSQKLDYDDARLVERNPLVVVPEKTTHLVIHTDQDELRFSPKASPTDEVKIYLTLLKTIKLERIIRDNVRLKKVKKMGKYWLEVQKEGQDVALRMEVGEALSGERKEYPMRVVGYEPTFVISQRVFDKVFGDLDDLKPDEDAV